ARRPPKRLCPTEHSAWSRQFRFDGERSWQQTPLLRRLDFYPACFFQPIGPTTSEVSPKASHLFFAAAVRSREPNNQTLLLRPAAPSRPSISSSPQKTAADFSAAFSLVGAYQREFYRRSARGENKESRSLSTSRSPKF